MSTIAPISTQTPTELSVCVDCLFILANGEAGDKQQTADHIARMNAYSGDVEITLGGLDEEDELGFSWSQCDACGSTLGGDRHAAVVWTA